MDRRPAPRRPRPRRLSPTTEALFRRLPEGWSEASYDGARWGVSMTVAVGGRVMKLYAERLGGPGVVSANLYLTGDGSGAELRPCEMPAETVLAFLAGAEASS